MKMSSEIEKELLKEVLRKLEEAIDLKEQGNEAESNILFENTKRFVENKVQEIKGVLRQDSKMLVDRAKFPKEGQRVAEGNKIFLSVLSKNEKEEYLEVSCENSVVKKWFEEEKFRENMWEEFCSDKSFVCSIYDKHTKKYIGYCSVKDISKDDWEIAIELKAEKCHKGYGSDALAVFMNKVHQLTEQRFFRARVEIDNYASQGLMKKLGGIPDGISEFMLHGNDIKKFQKEYKDRITEEMRNVAEEFCMEAEDILGYVLEYRFDMERLRNEGYC